MSNTLALNFNTQLAVLGQEVESYTRTVKTIPMLSADEERVTKKINTH
jgi:RNA polymerase sigma-32 factor